MTRHFTSLIVTVVIMTMVLIAWTPTAKSGKAVIVFDDCLDFCIDQAICQCAKILGGSLRLTVCNIGASCNRVCECDVDPLCKLWEKDVVVATFPPVNLWCGGDAM